MSNKPLPDPRQDNDKAPKDNLSAGYQQVCDSYRAIDDLRMKLLGLLPLATGGVFLLADNKVDTVQQFLGAIGAFGFVITVGLFAYELHGMKKCGNLISTGRNIETSLGIYGQFRSRPHEVAGFIDEPFAASVIYPASLGAWAFLALAFTAPPIGLVSAIAAFVVGFVVSLCLVRLMELDLNDPKFDSNGMVSYVREPNLRDVPDMLRRVIGIGRKSES